MDITLHKLDEIKKELIKIRAILDVNRLVLSTYESPLIWIHPEKQSDDIYIYPDYGY